MRAPKALSNSKVHHKYDIPEKKKTLISNRLLTHSPRMKRYIQDNSSKPLYPPANFSHRRAKNLAKLDTAIEKVKYTRHYKMTNILVEKYLTGSHFSIAKWKVV